MWLDSEPALAKSDEEGDVEDRVWGQLVQLEPVEAKKTPNKQMQEERKTANDERKEHHSKTRRRTSDYLIARKARVILRGRKRSILAPGQQL